MNDTYNYIIDGCLPLLNTITNQGGSGRGISFYKLAVACSRKMHLEKALADVTPPSSYAAQVGTLFHALMELYYWPPARKNVALEIDTYNLDDAFSEALRLFEAYTERFPPDELGEIVGTEIPIETEFTPGVLFTGRIDLICRLDAAAAARLEETREISVQPGLYLVDHKTKGAVSRTLQFEYQNDLQMDAYQMAWNVLHPEDPCVGMLTNCVFRYKKLDARAFTTIVCAIPDEDRQQQIKEWLAYADEKSKENVPNLAACMGPYGPCAHLVSGLCSRRRGDGSS